jgi:hypothetical protein
MRIKFKSGLVLLAAMFALSAVGVSSASAALPEFTGRFPDKMVLKTTREVKLEAAEGEGWGVVCLGGLEAEGSITGAKTATTKLTLKNCRYPGDNEVQPCTSTGMKAGEIRTEELPVVPVYTSKSKKEVALDFNEYTTKKLAKERPTFAKYTCASFNETVRGAVIVPVTPVNVETSSFTLKPAETNGKQLPTWFENEEGTKVTNILEGTFGGAPEYYPEGFGSSETVSLKTEVAHVLKA